MIPCHSIEKPEIIISLHSVDLNAAVEKCYKKEWRLETSTPVRVEPLPKIEKSNIYNIVAIF
jgi:hypothetical protein